MCGALPCYPWLDGMSAGEQAPSDRLHLLLAKGVAAIYMVSDWNQNIPDPEKRRVKLKKPSELAQPADRLALPLLAGTEMNSFGQKLVDDFDAAELASLRRTFLDGAYFLHGHARTQRAIGLAYQSCSAVAHFPARREWNKFYTEVGRLVRPGRGALDRIAGSARRQARRKSWPIGAVELPPDGGQHPKEWTPHPRQGQTDRVPAGLWDI